MAAPTSTNEVTARRLASVITQLWAKIKETFAAKSHSHQISDVSSLSTSLNNKMSTSGGNATDEAAYQIFKAGAEVTNPVDNTPIGASGLNAAAGASYIRYSTLKSKILDGNAASASAAASGSALETAINSKQDTTAINDGCLVWEDRCSSGYVYKIGLPSGDTSFASILCNVSVESGWPIVFVIGYRWNTSSFSTGCTPKVAFLYSTNHNPSQNKMVAIKYSVSNKAIYLKFGHTDDHRLSFSLSSKRSGTYTFSQIEASDSEYTGATDVDSGDIEGCVMKTEVGTAIGNYSTPVFVNASGFLAACTSINAASSDDADKVDGWHINVDGSSSGNGGTIYFA